MIELRAVAALIAGHASREQCHWKPDGTQQPGKRSIQFVAEATAALLHDLSNKSVLIAHNLSAESNVEIFERDTEHVGPMQVAQNVWSGRERSDVGDAVEISGDVEHGGIAELRSNRQPGAAARYHADYTGNSSCIQPISGFGSDVRSSTNFSSTIRLLGGFERNARSVFATSRMARVSSRFDL